LPIAYRHVKVVKLWLKPPPTFGGARGSVNRLTTLKDPLWPETTDAPGKQKAAMILTVPATPAQNSEPTRPPWRVVRERRRPGGLTSRAQRWAKTKPNLSIF